MLAIGESKKVESRQSRVVLELEFIIAIYMCSVNLDKVLVGKTNLEKREIILYSTNE